MELSYGGSCVVDGDFQENMNFDADLTVEVLVDIEKYHPERIQRLGTWKGYAH